MKMRRKVVKMKSKAKSILMILMTLGIIFALLPVINNSLNFNAGNSNKSPEYRDDISLDNEKLKLSEVSGKIHIYDNWSVTESTYSWCTGSGTWSDPFLIQDLIIDGGGSGSCILIENSNVYFRIENCTVSNSGSNSYDAGIELNSVRNGSLFNNSASNHDNYGILLSNSNNNTISGNIANSNDNGIVLFYSENNTISENIANSNTNWYGIELSHSHNNTVLGNNAIGNLNGIVLFYSENNNISENIANSNVYHGIYLQDSHYNIVTLNMIKGNGFGGGTYALFMGAWGDPSHGNSIFLNSFINNNKNAFNDGVNYWDNGVKGNYWNDYSGKDADDDGIGDTPYVIPGNIASQDNFPIWWDAPIISIDSPTANATFSNTAPGYEISIEGIPDSMWYTIEGIAGNFPITELNGTIDQDTWDSLDDGDINMTFYAQDSESEIGSTSIIVIKNIQSTPTPDGIPGYNLFFLLGILSVVAIVISTKLKKFNK